MKKSLMFLLIAMMLVSLSTGCASKYAPQQTKVNYYPACYDPIQKLRNSEHDVAKGTAAGAGIGAVAGAGLGFLLSGGKAEGAIAGGIAGLAAGGIIGNQIAKTRQIEDENKRMDAYLSDIEGNISNLNIQTASAKAALQCYDQQFKILLTSVKSKKVSREEAQRMFDEIQSGTKEATALLGQLEADAMEGIKTRSLHRVCLPADMGCKFRLVPECHRLIPELVREYIDDVGLLLLYIAASGKCSSGYRYQYAFDRFHNAIILSFISSVLASLDLKVRVVCLLSWEMLTSHPFISAISQSPLRVMSIVVSAHGLLIHSLP